ncbi:MAG: DUF1957 domain-containing protein, partial [Spirochaetaceae bacterium]|nr:DUF1957 domain-containing protein [Spirochaetaceae bacterium]
SGNYPRNSIFRSYFDDSGFELPAGSIRPFLSANGMRVATGYKYQTTGEEGQNKQLYNVGQGMNAAREKARIFLDNRIKTLRSARLLMSEKLPVSLCAYDADFFGRFWYEGWVFIEELFRAASEHVDIQFMTPSEYLSRLEIENFQTITPVFSSQGFNGYGESYLDSSNDWVYRHLLRAGERMVELAERFNGESDDLRERALNQAAREMLLAQSSDWVRIITTGEYHLTREWSNYARNRVEMHLRNFTTFYEALGSDYISTRFLTELEQKNNIFPDINYRIFQRKSFHSG